MSTTLQIILLQKTIVPTASEEEVGRVDTALNDVAEPSLSVHTTTGLIDDGSLSDLVSISISTETIAAGGSCNVVEPASRDSIATDPISVDASTSAKSSSADYSLLEKVS